VLRRALGSFQLGIRLCSAFHHTTLITILDFPTFPPPTSDDAPASPSCHLLPISAIDDNSRCAFCEVFDVRSFFVIGSSVSLSYHDPEYESTIASRCYPHSFLALQQRYSSGAISWLPSMSTWIMQVGILDDGVDSRSIANSLNRQTRSKMPLRRSHTI